MIIEFFKPQKTCGGTILPMGSKWHVLEFADNKHETIIIKRFRGKKKHIVFYSDLIAASNEAKGE